MAASITPKIEEVLILHGGRSSGWPDSSSFSNLPYPVRQITIQELEYDDAKSTTSLEDCDRAIQGVIREEKLTPKDTLFHFHNHSLGKNASLTHSVSSIAESGFHCLLQIHDFAEDFRPDNYQHLLKFANRHHFEIDRFLYPIAGHIHYAVLNSRDYKHQDISSDDSSRGLNRMAADIISATRDALAECNIDIPSAHDLVEGFKSTALRLVDNYAIDSKLNGLNYDRASESDAVDLFADRVADTWQQTTDATQGCTSILPSWDQLISQDSEILSRFSDIIRNEGG